MGASSSSALGELAAGSVRRGTRSIIAAFRAGKNADVSTLGPKGEVLKVTKVNLDGFGREMDACTAIWAKGRRSQPARRLAAALKGLAARA